MILRVSQLQPQDVRHLFCSDPQLQREVARDKRRVRQPAEPSAGWVYLEPTTEITSDETLRTLN